MLERIADEIWSAPMPLKLMGMIALNTRTTIVRYGEKLWVHSPIRLTPELKEEVDALGQVEVVVAPSNFHHLFIGDWLSAYPEARGLIPRGLSKKRPDLAELAQLDPTSAEEWRQELLEFPIKGMPLVNESLFYHRSSQTLIITDLCFFLPQATGITALYALLNGAKKHLGTTYLFKLAIKDQDAFLDSLRPLLELELAHLSMCHHFIQDKDAQPAFRQLLGRLGVSAT